MIHFSLKNIWDKEVKGSCQPILFLENKSINFAFIDKNNNVFLGDLKGAMEQIAELGGQEGGMPGGMPDMSGMGQSDSGPKVEEVD